MRTSPTNIGLQLLATVSAYDLGFITIENMTERLEQAVRSLERLRRFRGHFYNWYDLHDLQVLEPAYISTVDSGNLAGHLIALRAGVPRHRRRAGVRRRDVAGARAGGRRWRGKAWRTRPRAGDGAAHGRRGARADGADAADASVAVGHGVIRARWSARGPRSAAARPGGARCPRTREWIEWSVR